ncbi:MAG: xanthine dehydrogenase family protein molybdopterin-binding subunit [Pseudomonadota bacterium]|nr:xanthine dehydrogenase family protein molybdopterin-binding subunit [Pseudomonadota bacterium]
MAYSLLGKNFTPPDVEGKVTGRAKYAEDFRVEGMVFCRLFLSPIPHGRVTNIDADEALEMEGVLGILTADEVPSHPANPILTNEPKYIGEPILAVAAVDETTAMDALDRIQVEIEPLPFVVDPLNSLFPGGPNARSDGNVGTRGVPTETLKWTARDFAAEPDDVLPMGENTFEDWSYGDLEEGFRNAALVLDETFVTAANSHHSMEPRSNMAYWENGRCHVFGSCQSQSFVLPALSRAMDEPVENLRYVGEFCGGGFGSKGHAYPLMAIPPLMSKKINRPVMMRISRTEEYYLGIARGGFQGRARLGFSGDGRILAADLYLVQDAGPTEGFWDFRSGAEHAAVTYTPVAMRARGVPVHTNTIPRGPQRGPGQNQMANAIEPLIDKAAKELGIDRLEIRKINAPVNGSLVEEHRVPVTSAYMNEALEKGAEMFNWSERSARSGQRRGSKVTGVAVGQGFHPASFAGFDGLVRLSPEGKLHIHTGVGNLGTYSHTGTSRVAAEILKCNWENCIIVRGDSDRHLPWNSGQFGSNTSGTQTRTAYAAAMNAVEKLKEIAAIDLGGSPEDYEIGDEKVYRTEDSSVSISYADAAQRAIELGGKYSGQEVPDDLHPITKRAVSGLAGSGLIGVSKDNLDPGGMTPALVAGFMEIELDVETGKFEIIDYVGVADCGTVIHPQGLATQIKGGAVMGIGLAALERIIYDPQNGLPANIGFYQAKPPSYLDVPSNMQWDAVDQPDLVNPVGVKGIGEPVQGAASAALVCAISDALGGHYFNRTPIVADMIVNAVSGQEPSHKPLQISTA